MTSDLFNTDPIAVPPLGITLRDYQKDAVAAVYAWFEKRLDNPLIEMPTGTGKSVVIAGLIEGILRLWPKQRILVATHVRELVEQNAAKMRALWPEAPIGVYSAGLKRRETDANVIFAGIQSIHHRAGELGWFDLVLVDEAHLLPKKGTGMYRRYLADLASMNPAAKVIGFTATPYRTDSGSLIEGKDRLFGGIAYSADMVSLIQQGYLVPVVPKHVEGEIDTRGVKKQAGEFHQGEIERRALAGDRIGVACDEIVSWGATRRSWLVFGCGVGHGKAVEAALRARGVDVASVFGDTPMDERDELTRRYKTGDLRCLVNCAVLTTGFDAPGTDLIAIMRPTCSPGLFVQMNGRGMRPADGKTNCLVLDFGGNVERHGPIDRIRPKKVGDEPGVAPVKTCPQCKTIVFAGLRECPECGFEFPRSAEPKHATTAASKHLIAGLDPNAGKSREVLVKTTSYREHRKTTVGMPTMKVEYLIGAQGVFSIAEWIAFEHSGYARHVAEGWWLQRGRPPVPATVSEALARTKELRPVTGLRIEAHGKYPKILGYAFSADQAGEGAVHGPVREGARRDSG